jgi:hypothetical protein
MTKRLTVHARATTRERTWEFVVIGQTARTLLALVESRPGGCTALEVSAWALRFAAYCHDLKHKHGLDIVTEREDHPGGWHGRHILMTDVTILYVGGIGKEAA